MVSKMKGLSSMTAHRTRTKDMNTKSAESYIAWSNTPPEKHPTAEPRIEPETSRSVSKGWDSFLVIDDTYYISTS